MDYLSTTISYIAALTSLCSVYMTMRVSLIVIPKSIFIKIAYSSFRYFYHLCGHLILKTTL